MNKKHEEMKREAIEDIMECLEDYSGYYCDLHDDETNKKIIEGMKKLYNY